MFNKSTLVLEGVTLAKAIKFVIEMLVDLAASPILDEEAAEDTKPSHPHHLTINWCISI